MRPRRSFLALAAAFTIGVAACGAGETATSTGATPGTAAPTADGATNVSGSLFPDVQVQNISDGSMLNLQEELDGGDLPVLLWFWAPH